MRAIKTTVISILAVGLLAGSAVGVAAQRAQSIFVTGTRDVGSCFDEEGDEFGQQTLRCVPVVFETTDQRLNGTTEIITYGLRGPSSDAYESLTIGTDVFRLENEGGAWSGRGISYSMFPGDEEWVDVANWLLVGEGGYEGLSAYLSYAGEDDADVLTGVIIERPLPLLPEEASAE